MEELANEQYSRPMTDIHGILYQEDRAGLCILFGINWHNNQ